MTHGDDQEHGRRRSEAIVTCRGREDAEENPAFVYVCVLSVLCGKVQV
jgi:hypothetical protein